MLLLRIPPANKNHLNCLAVAREKKPKGIQFMNDLVRRTLDRSAEKIPQMLEHRKNSKT